MTSIAIAVTISLFLLAGVLATRRRGDAFVPVRVTQRYRRGAPPNVLRERDRDPTASRRG
ncbi:MAG TPA: hypothetical protein VHD15_03815 [Hyphomicrobiales bacterium]|nr:hypothetical protein [Hyphomicrobiales bacterium]